VSMQRTPLLKAIDWMSLERLIVLSPHLDDGALSCGGLLAATRDKVSRLVITVTAGTRARERKGFASPTERRREDRAAMRELDCDFVHLGFADAVYRTSPVSGQLIYRDSRERLAAPPIDDAGHVEELYVVLRRLSQDLGNVLVLSPLGIGQHVDHAICARVALRLFGASANLLFYEDFPYVLDGYSAGVPDDDPRQAIARLGRAAVGRHRVAIDAEAKLSILSHYHSQIALLFGDTTKLAAAVRGHGTQGRAEEVYWRLGANTRNKRRKQGDAK
jgi:LmbE family N-acetylglucosaminyl deacetylase